MFIFFPYRVDVPHTYRPWLNWLFVIVVIFVFCIQIADLAKHADLPGGLDRHFEDTITARYSLDGWGIRGLLGSIWLHGGIMHLIWNSLYLWLFGNAVCSKLGNLRYLPVYLLLGVAGGIGHLLFSGGRAAGASGAISGLIGMHLVFFPENSLSCFFCWIFLPHRPVWFSVRSFWLILLWFVLNIYGAMRGTGNVGYFAHIGGFVTGAGLAILLLKTNHITMEKHERSILDLLGLESKKPKPIQSRGDRTRRQCKGQTDERPEGVLKKPPVKSEQTRAEFISFKCRCGKPIKISRKHAGRTGRCPRCSAIVKVPPA
jgi:membrane associated rhomboid family serine protease